VVPFSHLAAGYPVVRRVNERFAGDFDEVSTAAVFDARSAGRRTHPLPVHDGQVAVRVGKTWDNLEQLAMATTGAR
jgi:hypothetical protein